MDFIKNHQIREIAAPVVAGASIDQNSDRIDMSGFESATFVVPITDCVDNGVATLAIEQNSVDSDTGMAALSGAVATSTSEANDDLNGSLLIVEVNKPRKRYLQAVLTSSVANIAFGNTIVILSGPRLKPVARHMSVVDMALATEPAES